MDFSVTVPQEWLQRRRSQVAEASRKIRAKKKKEEEELREENAKLRQERTALLNKITELEKTISSLSERDEDLENELLRMQLEQHKGFLKGFLETVASIEPSETSSKGELSRQNRDFAWMYGLRCIAESQLDRGSVWKSVELPVDNLRLPGNADYSILYSRPRPDTLHIRCDLVYPRVDARTLRDTMTKYWYELQMFQSVFGKDKRMSSRELPEFSVDDLKTGEQLRAYHCREPIGAKFTDVVFLTAMGNTVLSKSTLQLPPGRGPTLSQSIANQDVHPPHHGPARSSSSSSSSAHPTASGASTSTSKRAKSASDPVEWGICGTANVYYAIRTVTGHGLEKEEEKMEENVERIMSTGLEILLAWDEEIESLDPEVSGPCCRSVTIFSLPSDFKFPVIGGIDDFVDPNGKVGIKFVNAFKNLVGVLMSKLANVPKLNDNKSDTDTTKS